MTGDPCEPTGDPFGTDSIRRRVLDAWAASPARFREDANAEEDYALGGYRDRVVVELAQNAADAALRAGVPGRLRFELDGGVLQAANTGEPLTAEGVESLSTLRASAKHGSGTGSIVPESGTGPIVPESGTVGRFGVGFAAVVAVTDEPLIASRTGAVRWSRAESAALAPPSLSQEIERRGGHVPVLRLPFPAAGDVPVGFDSVVRLALRDDAAIADVERQLAEAGPALLLALPALDRIEVRVRGSQNRVITAPTDWTVVSDAGELAPGLVEDRPAEERARPYWRISWAFPPGDMPADVPAVIHAPTPSGERLDLPALLIASFPLTPDRRHVAPGPLSDFLVERAAALFVDGLSEVRDVLPLLPGPVAGGEWDAALRRAIVKRLRDAPVLPGGVRPRDAVVIDGPLSGFLGEFREPGGGRGLDGLIPGWPARHPAYAQLGIRAMHIADVIDLLGAVDRPPEWWRSLYDVLAGGPVADLGALPVPLADGRTVRGPRGTLTLHDHGIAQVLEPLGLRVVHPDAVHPLLLRLGAQEATPRSVLEDPLTRTAVAGSLDAEDPEPVAQAVLTLAEAAALAEGELPWLAELALPDSGGSRRPAGELLLPDGPMARLVDPDAPFGTVAPELVERYGSRVLAAVGVVGGLQVMRDTDVLLEASDHDLDDEDLWAAQFSEGEICHDFAAVRDLELIRDWDAALPLLASPPLRQAVLTEPSYTAWWLRRNPVLGGRKPYELRIPDGDPLLDGLYEPTNRGDLAEAIHRDTEFLKAIGARSSLPALLVEPDGPDELLARLADPVRSVGRAQLRSIWRALASVDADRITPPERIRAVRDGEVIVADASEVVVAEAPDLLPLLTGAPLVLAPFDLAETLADLLDLPLAGEEVAGSVESAGSVTEVPRVAAELMPVPETYREHSKLVVDGVTVMWRFVDGVLHANGVDGLARGLAWAAGRWSERHALAAILRDPDSAPLLAAESDLTP